MNKKFLSAVLFGALMVSSTGTFVSCKDYDESSSLVSKRVHNHTIHCLISIKCNRRVISLSVQPLFQAFSIRFHTKATCYNAIILSLIHI